MNCRPERTGISDTRASRVTGWGSEVEEPTLFYSGQLKSAIYDLSSRPEHSEVEGPALYFCGTSGNSTTSFASNRAAGTHVE